jgi:hypothetical protein
MRVRHVLIRIGFVSTAGVGGVIVTPPTSIRYALLRKPAKACDSSGMCGGLSTEPMAYCDRAYRQVRGPEQVGMINTFMDFSVTN